MTDRLYKISELSDEFGITSRTLRHYEDFGLLSPTRKGNQRLYNYGDRIRLKLILRGKRIGFALHEIKEILDMYELPEGEQKQTSFLLRKIQQRRDALIQQRRDIDSMLGALDDIETRLNERG